MQEKTLQKTKSSTQAEYILLGLAVLVNLSGLFTKLQEPDAALYASISRSMTERMDLVNLMSMGKDWLDKPHLPFWIAVLSFNLAGVSTVAYKLPAILFLFLGARFTYLLGKDLGGKNTGFLASFMLLCSEHIILSNNDVRAEPYLTAFLIGAVFHFRRSMNLGARESSYEPDAVAGLASGNVVEKLKKSIWNSPRSSLVHLFLACLLTACAIMTKGIFILIIIAGGFILDFLISKNWAKLFNWRWILVWMLIAIFILPELYCLYVQFDLHPEKVIFGRTHVSGIRFFFWDSQFGRFMNSGPIKGDGNPFFFFHTLLWAFLPWPIIILAAIWEGIKDWKVQFALAIERKQGIFICAGVSITAFLLFSASSFQLPHYTNIIFPFLCIICASYINRIGLLYENFKPNVPDIEPTQANRLRNIQYGISILVICALVIILILVQPPAGSYWVMVLAAHAVFGTWLICNRMMKTRTLFMSAIISGLAILFVNICLNGMVFPLILQYQSGSEAAFYMNRNYPGVPFRQSGVYSYSLAFYAQQAEIFEPSIPDTTHRLLVFSNHDPRGDISAPLKYIKTFYNFHTTKLSLPFLNSSTRSSVLQPRFLSVQRH